MKHPLTLPRTLSPLSAIMLVVGNVVGAGIFTTGRMLAQDVSHPLLFIGVWVLGGILAMMGALTYAELGAMFPRAGGDYQFIKEAYGPLAGMLLGWIGFWIIFPGSMAALSIAITGYIPNLPPIWGGNKGYAILIILMLGALNVRSTKLASWIQSVSTIGSLVLLFGLVVGGILSENGHFEHLTSGGGALQFKSSAMVAVFFTYSGWFAAAYVGSEVVRPERNVPLALILGTFIVMLLYTGVNVVYLLALPLKEMSQTAELNTATLAATRLFGPTVSHVVGIAIVLAIASCINASVMTGSRLCFAMAEDRIMPAKLGQIHSRFKTPFVALTAQVILAIFFVIFGAFDTLLSSVVFAMLLSNTATGIAHLKLRIERPDIPRSYRTHGYPVLPILFTLAHGVFAVTIAMENLAISLLGIGIALTALPFYFWQRRGRPNHTDTDITS